jgi:hypothetical protein
VTTASPGAVPVGMALPGLVIAFGMIGDTLLYAVLPLYHEQFGLSLAMFRICVIFQRRFSASASTGPTTAGSTTPTAPLWGSRINHT